MMPMILQPASTIKNVLVIEPASSGPDTLILQRDGEFWKEIGSDIKISWATWVQRLNEGSHWEQFDESLAKFKRAQERLRSSKQQSPAYLSKVYAIYDRTRNKWKCFTSITTMHNWVDVNRENLTNPNKPDIRHVWAIKTSNTEWYLLDRDTYLSINAPVPLDVDLKSDMDEIFEKQKLNLKAQALRRLTQEHLAVLGLDKNGNHIVTTK